MPGRYLFMPFETGTAGVQRVDLQNPHYDTRTVTIVAPGTDGFVSGDASRWTPWGGYLTGEESWGAGSVKGRLFEVTNPITAGPDERRLRVADDHSPRVPRRARLRQRQRRCISLTNSTADRSTSTCRHESGRRQRRRLLRRRPDVRAEGRCGRTVRRQQRPGDYRRRNVGGHHQLRLAVPIAGVSTVLPDGTIDGRASADDNDVMATGYNRPEDMVLQTLADGTQLLYFATTDSDVNGSGARRHQPRLHAQPLDERSRAVRGSAVDSTSPPACRSAAA